MATAITSELDFLQPNECFLTICLMRVKYIITYRVHLNYVQNLTVQIVCKNQCACPTRDQGIILAQYMVMSLYVTKIHLAHHVCNGWLGRIGHVHWC